MIKEASFEKLNSKKHTSVIIAFILFISFHFSHAQEYKVSIVPIGEVSSEHLDIVKSAIQNFYNIEISVEDSIAISPAFITKFDTILNATAINEFLSDYSNSPNQKVMGVTDWSITIGDRVPMICRGYAGDGDGSSATVSSYKVLREARADTTLNFGELLGRVAKHELGHSLGLAHCENDQTCLMTFGNNFLEAKGKLCQQCISKIDSKLIKNNPTH